MPAFSGLFSQRLPNLLGGVSQAPDTLMQPNEFKTLDNILVDPLNGLYKRPGSFHVASLCGYTSDLDTAFYYHWNHTDTERYIVVVTNGDLKVYDAITGIEQTVYFPHGKAYLAYTGTNKWRATTVGETTYMTNRDFTVLRDYDTFSDTRVREAIVTFYQATPDTDNWVDLTVNGERVVSGRHKTTIDLAAGMAEAFSDIDILGNDFDVTVYGPSISFRRKDGRDFPIYGSDSYGGNAMKIVKGAVKSVEELPIAAPPGTFLKVAGQASAVDDYWVVAQTADPQDKTLGTFTIWKETTAPGIPTKLDRFTMPHKLVRFGDYTSEMSYSPFDVSLPFAEGNVSYTKKMGYAFDEAGGSQDPTKSRVVTDSGTGGYTDVTDDHPPSGTAKGTWAWSIDTSDVPVGHVTRVVVELKTDVGSSLHSETFEYPAGIVSVLETHSVEFSTATPCIAYINLYHDVGEAPGGADYPRLGLFGDQVAAPGFKVEYYDLSTISVADYGETYPAFMRVQIALDVGSCDFELDVDTTAEDLATRIAEELEASDARLSCTVVASTSALSRWKVNVQIDAERPPLTMTGTYTLDESFVFYDPNADLTPDTLNTLTLNDNTIGATGNIIGNGKWTIKLDGGGLKNGTRTTFRDGDEVTVNGAGGASFVFMAVDWEERKVGSIKQSPWPSFLDNSIQDVFYHRSRLGFISGNKVVLAAHGTPERLFRKTVTAVLDDDPIDVEVASRFATVLESAVEWNGMLVLSTTGGMQYSLNGTPILSPNTVTLEVISSYLSSDYTRPYTLGGSLVFAQKEGSYTQIREMFEGIYGRIESHQLTEKIPQYIPGDVVCITGDADLGIMACIVNDGTHRQYVYVWRYKYSQTGELLVSAWGQWFFQHTNRIFSIDFYRGKLTLLTKSWPSDPSGYLGTGATYLALEYIDVTRPPLDSESNADRQGAAGGVISINSKVKLPVLYRRAADGVPQTEGRTQVRQLKVDYTDTQYFAVSVDPGGPAVQRHTRIPNATVASTTKQSGSLKVPVLCENTQVTTIEISNTGATGFNITGIEWEAYFHSRNVRV